MSHWEAKACPFFEHFILAGDSGPTLCNCPDGRFGELTEKRFIESGRDFYNNDAEKALRERFIGVDAIRTCNHGERRGSVMFHDYLCPVLNDPSIIMKQSRLDVDGPKNTWLKPEPINPAKTACPDCEFYSKGRCIAIEGECPNVDQGLQSTLEGVF